MTEFMHKVLKALETDGDLTVFDMGDLFGVSSSYARQYGIAPLREAGLIRVSAWLRGKRGCPMMVVSITNGKDAPRPKRLPPSVTNTRWRERHDAGITKANNSLAILARGFRRNSNG